MGKNGKLLIAALIVVVFAVAATLLGACSAPWQPQPCATWLHPDGVTWMEEDNEPVDDDPCDRLPNSKPSSKAPPMVKDTKPVPKPSAAKTTKKRP